MTEEREGLERFTNNRYVVGKMVKHKSIFFIAVIIFSLNGVAAAKWQVKFDSEANRVMHMNGDTLRGNFATEKQCQAYQNSRPSFERNHSKCVGSDSSSSGGSGVSIPSKSKPGQALALGIVGSALESLLAPPAGPSAEEIARKQAEEAEARRIAAEEERRHAEEIARQQAKDKTIRLAYAGQMKNANGESAPSGGAATGPLAWKGLDADMTLPAASEGGVYIGNGTIPALLRKAGAATAEEWASAREWQARIDELMRKRPLSSAEAAELEALETKRDGLWKRAVAVPGLTADEREMLRLRMSYDGSGAVQGTPDILVQASEAKAGIGSMLAMSGASITKGADLAIETAGEEFTVKALGERPPSFGDAYAVGKIALTAHTENKEAAIAEAADWVIGKIPISPLSLGTAAAGKEIYTSVVWRSFDNALIEIHRVVPGTLPPGGTEEFWSNLRENLTTGQKVVYDWVKE